METMISIPFFFQEKCFYTLVRTRRKANSLELRVTIMNGELEKTLFGHNTFECRNGYLIGDCPEGPAHLAELRLALLHAIDGYLQHHPLEQLEYSN